MKPLPHGPKPISIALPSWLVAKATPLANQAGISLQAWALAAIHEVIIEAETAK